jgi:hypothetical protein
MVNKVCPECGAVLRDIESCQEQFHALLYLENENPAEAAQVHHLMVMCYMLQHNSYSDEAATGVIGMLEANLKRGVPPAELRRRMKDEVDSGNRKWKITGSTTFTRGLAWSMTIVDIDSADPACYAERVTEWARSVLATIRVQRDKPHG